MANGSGEKENQTKQGHSSSCSSFFLSFFLSPISLRASLFTLLAHLLIAWACQTKQTKQAHGRVCESHTHAERKCQSATDRERERRKQRGRETTGVLVCLFVCLFVCLLQKDSASQSVGCLPPCVLVFDFVSLGLVCIHSLSFHAHAHRPYTNTHHTHTHTHTHTSTSHLVLSCLKTKVRGHRGSSAWRANASGAGGASPAQPQTLETVLFGFVSHPLMKIYVTPGEATVSSAHCRGCWCVKLQIPFSHNQANTQNNSKPSTPIMCTWFFFCFCFCFFACVRVRVSAVPLWLAF